MANSVSSRKRIRQNARSSLRNRTRKSVIKTGTRKFFDALHAGDLDTAKTAFVDVQKKLDQVAAAGTLHKNTVARRKSRLAHHLNTAISAAGAG